MSPFANKSSETIRYDRSKLVVISGCSGGGKSTLIQALADSGQSVVPEPGRQIVKNELAGDGDALPWLNIEKFANECIQLSIASHDLAAASKDQTFFDRSLVDGVVALKSRSLDVPDLAIAALARCRYADPVFLVPPWEDLFENDIERKHSFSDACLEYNALQKGYRAQGYQTMVVPKNNVAGRLKWLENELNFTTEIYTP